MVMVMVMVRGVLTLLLAAACLLPPNQGLDIRTYWGRAGWPLQDVPWVTVTNRQDTTQINNIFHFFKIQMMLKSNLVFKLTCLLSTWSGGARFTECFPLIVMYIVHYLLHLNKPVCCLRARE